MTLEYHFSLGNELKASRLLAGMREASDQVVQELQELLAGVDAEMTHKAAHLSAADKRLAAELALRATEQHSAGCLADAQLDPELAAKRA